ncbi:predicted protein [Naegleria gruberi]|uniref:Predicted protein n=1 Tax=Naegleria gruberi TaxID=5762 RepID=D2VF14_NAEGR|nr:uncharacterized protein NAEGRDRAFT_79702 [Naegleria gruberi]EFC44603.1 predicted protein [Naegleria gruberi]|eukprot:XP_002677347.1 predicted protein [Naegleria gruberi strain NEG-M]
MSSTYQNAAYDEVAHQPQPSQPPQYGQYPVILDDHGQPIHHPSAQNYPQLYVDETMPPNPPLKTVLREVFSPFPKRFVASSLAGLVLTLTNVLLFVYLLFWIINSSVNAFEYKTGYGVFVLLFTGLMSGLTLVLGSSFMRMLVECFLSVYALREKKSL